MKIIESNSPVDSGTPEKEALIPVAKRPLTVIEPGYRSFIAEVRELWKYRDLFYFLVWRDIKVRYKQTVLGVLWAVLQPFVQMIIFTIFFGRLAGIAKELPPEISYPIFAYSALLLWNFFAGALNRSSESLVTNAHIITKNYFPRVIVPASAGLSAMVDFLCALLIMGGMMAYYGVVPQLSILTLPLFLLMTYMLAVSFGLFMSAINVRFRDVRYIIPFFIQIWMFLSPVIYPLSMIEKKNPTLAKLMLLNPMTGVIEGFHWAFFGKDWPFPYVPLLVSLIITIVSFMFGQWYFRKVERTFADVI
jgi:lipopolysaccharide transport system permease protein